MNNIDKVNKTLLDRKTESRYKSITKEVETIDTTTGEIITTQTTSKYKSEPSFIKLYLQDIELLHGISNNGILGAFLKQMNYGNQVVVNSYVKKIVALTSGSTVKNVEKQMSLYLKKEIWVRVDRGVYRFNPYLFGKGKWVDVQKIRMTIEYIPKVGRVVTTNIKRTTNMTTAIKNAAPIE